MIKIEDGILMCGRFSIGWNLHASRTVKTIAFPVAVAWASRAPGDSSLLITLGPVMVVWLL